jgi:peptidyl-prolyl cis-trans isomerase SurA
LARFVHRNMRIQITLLAAALLAVVGAGSCPAAGSVYEDGYAAQVNTNIITMSDVLAAIQPVEKQLRETYEGEELDREMEKLFKQGLDSLIERELILADFVAQKGELPARIVDEEINNVIRDRFDNNRVEFYKALAEERMTLDEWREETRKRLVVSLLRRREVGDRVSLSPLALREEYERRADEFRVPEQVGLRVIVLNKGTNDEDRVAKQSEAEAIRARVEAGEDFAQLARSESEGIKASEGGDLGWLDPASLRRELVDVVKALEPNQVSGVVETEDEFWIVRLEGRKKASAKPYEDVSKDLEQELRKKEADRLYNAWMERLKRKYFVKIFTP